MTEQELLQSTVDYYSADTNRICKSEVGCRYSPITVGKAGISEGCAIGRHIDRALADEIDNVYGGISIGTLTKQTLHFNRLPKWMQNMSSRFLDNVQAIHDTDEYWDNKGITDQGKMFVNTIVSQFGLQSIIFKETEHIA